MIFITGATDGIGLALARLFHARGERLILTGRRPLDDLDAHLFSEANYCRADLAEAGAADRIEAFLRDRGVDALTALVHNAGAGYVGPPAAQPIENIERLVAVNFAAPMALTQALLPRLERGRGRLVFVSSVVSVLPSPRYAVYAATKKALDEFARNLRIELAGTPVFVQVIHPGAVRTGFHEKSGLKIDFGANARVPDAAGAARAIARAMQGRRRQVTLGAANGLLRMAGRLAPGLMDTIAARGER